MIRSIAGSYRDFIAMCPITNLNAKLQKEIWFKNVKILEDLVFEVLVTLTDGNEVNHRFFKEILMSNILQGSMQTPFNTCRLMFFGFDPVHLFKCFYMNFINRKVFIFPKFDQNDLLLEARFADLKILYEMELGKPLRKAYKLSDKVLSPTNIERTNIMLADSVFHESTINALRFYGKKGNPSFLQTAELLSIFRQWFNEGPYQFLTRCRFALVCDSPPCPIRCNENRFGWSRQLNGGNYFNSVLQFLQSEKTIRIRSLVKMGFTISDVKEIFDCAVTAAQNEISFEVDHFIDSMDGIEYTLFFL